MVQMQTLVNDAMMAKVIGESRYSTGSGLYLHGIQQYHENLSDVVQKFNRNGIPIFLGTVASNLKDQTPLSDNLDVLAIYEQAKSAYNEGENSMKLPPCLWKLKIRRHPISCS